MIGKIEFPEGVTWATSYITGADFLAKGFESAGASLYKSAQNPVIDIKFDVVGSCSRMFDSCTNLKYPPYFDTSNVTSMSYMFYSAVVVELPEYNTANVTSMESMFNGCKSLKSIPQFNTSKVTSMQYMFSGCSVLESIPQLDMASATNISQMFYNCTALKALPNLNTVKVTNFGTSSYNSWLYGANKVESIGVVDCDSVTNIGYFWPSSNSYMTNFGGCRNLGKASSVSNTNSSYFLNYAPNLTYESVMNVLNLLYDRASAGLSVLTLKLHANHMAMLSDDDKAIATNKGWTLA